VGMFAVSWRPGELTENRERSFSADVRDALLKCAGPMELVPELLSGLHPADDEVAGCT